MDCFKVERCFEVDIFRVFFNCFVVCGAFTPGKAMLHKSGFALFPQRNRSHFQLVELLTGCTTVFPADHSLVGN
ncbi:MAG TPA: hypothetical protein VF670_10375, partial [Duganella sp.]